MERQTPAYFSVGSIGGWNAHGRAAFWGQGREAEDRPEGIMRDRDNDERSTLYGDLLDEPGVCEIAETALSPDERFRHRRLAVARRCAKRPPKTMSGQSPEQMRAARNFPRRRSRRLAR